MALDATYVFLRTVFHPTSPWPAQAPRQAPSKSELAEAAFSMCRDDQSRAESAAAAAEHLWQRQLFELLPRLLGGQWLDLGGGLLQEMHAFASGIAAFEKVTIALPPTGHNGPAAALFLAKAIANGAAEQAGSTLPLPCAVPPAPYVTAQAMAAQAMAAQAMAAQAKAMQLGLWNVHVRNLADATGGVPLSLSQLLRIPSRSLSLLTITSGMLDGPDWATVLSEGLSLVYPGGYVAVCAIEPPLSTGASIMASDPGVLITLRALTEELHLMRAPPDHLSSPLVRLAYFGRIKA